MKTKLLFLSLSLAPILGFGQYTQNFDGFTVGDYIGVQDTNWTTWSGTTGGTEDAQVSATQAKSGANSIYFNSTAASGGPQDVVLKFGDSYNTGQFSFEQAVFVEAGKGGYFNFQADEVIGTSWALNANLAEDSTLVLYDDMETYYSGKYPVGSWFVFKIETNLNTNSWEAFLDGASLGTFQLNDNRIASLNLYPTNGTNSGGNGLARYWIDDVAFNHVPYTLPNLNAGMYKIGVNLNPLENTDVTPEVEIRNLGTTAITSFDIAVTYGGVTKNQSVSGVSINSLETHKIKLNSSFTIAKGDTTFTAVVSNVNGMTTDGDATDDSKDVFINVFEPVPGKVVVVEEATGTWCGWCPRGTVAMDFLERDYHGYAAGIAVHNNDPMADSAYNSNMGPRISGYPAALVDRGTGMNPSAIFAPVRESLLQTPLALLQNGASYDPSTGILKVSVTADFNGAANNNWKLACAITEDSVTGTGSSYNQSNSYAGGGSGSLVGPDGVDWATLPGSVPASQMVYNHVARAIAPNFDGNPNSFPSIVSNGDSYTLGFEFVIDPSWDTEKMHIVGILIQPDGKIQNGSTSTIEEAEANGYVPAWNISIGENLIGPDVNVKIYPNPSANQNTKVYVNGAHKNVSIEVYTLSGKRVLVKDFGALENEEVTINTKNLKSGVYLVNTSLDGELTTQRLVVR